ncbi:Beta-lactamase-like protein 2 [Rhizoclosmatium sp. JEL0117]|nr:Beta-lactamase-like protein 2 [Rhizoclosmatium sp. JEL0117]
MATLHQLTPRVARLAVPPSGPYSKHASNLYLIGSQSAKTHLLIDTGNGHLDTSPSLKQFTINHVILTHAHGGHSNGLLALNIDPSTPLSKFKSKGDSAQNVRDKGKTGDLRFVKNGDVIVLKEKDGVDSTLEVIHTPGHSGDSISLWLKEEQCLFSGDAISSTPFTPSTTTTSTTTPTISNPSHQLIENLSDYTTTLKKLSSLGPRIILPGHGDVITNGLEYIDTAQTVLSKTSKTIFTLIQHHHAINALQITQYLLVNGLSANTLDIPKTNAGAYNVVLEGTVKLHLLELEKWGLVKRVFAAKDDTQNVSEAQKNQRGPGGLTYSTIFDAVKSSRQRDWAEKKETDGADATAFRVREQVHPAHLWIGLSNQVGWTAV